MRRIGVLMNTAANDVEGRNRITAFLQRLQGLGWTDGRNVQVDTRWASGKTGGYGKSATELVTLMPEVILANGTPAVAPLPEATRTIPIVFVSVIDPVGAGFVTSLAQPGGNATGFTICEYSMGGKWLELLKEIAPHLTRAAVLRDPAVASGLGLFGAAQAVAPSLRMELAPVDVRDAVEVERAVIAFSAFIKWRLGRDAKRSRARSSRSYHWLGCTERLIDLPRLTSRYARVARKCVSALALYAGRSPKQRRLAQY